MGDQEVVESPLVFLSYARPDQDRVLAVHDHLAHRSLNPWIDARRIKGGQNWDLEIQRALSRAAIILVFVSAASVDRRGYVQREIRVALDQARNRPADDIYIIPVLLDADVPLPEQLADKHALSTDEAEHLDQIEDAIRTQLDRLGIDHRLSQGQSEVHWTRASYADEWDGLPGYRTEISYPRLSSEAYPRIGEVTDIVKGDLLGGMQELRLTRFRQAPTYHNFGQARERRQDTWEAFCDEPVIVERVLGIRCSISWYGSGAAHPNYHFKTFCFLVDPVLRITGLEQAFRHGEDTFATVQGLARAQLLAQGPGDEDPDNDETYKLDEAGVNEGTKAWDSLSAFVFGPDGLTILFAPYQVAAYAFGPQYVTLAYEQIAHLLRHDLACALGHEYTTKRAAGEDVGLMPVAGPDSIADE